MHGSSRSTIWKQFGLSKKLSCTLKMKTNRKYTCWIWLLYTFYCLRFWTSFYEINNRFKELEVCFHKLDLPFFWTWCFHQFNIFYNLDLFRNLILSFFMNLTLIFLWTWSWHFYEFDLSFEIGSFDQFLNLIWYWIYLCIWYWSFFRTWCWSFREFDLEFLTFLRTWS